MGTVEAAMVVVVVTLGAGMIGVGVELAMVGMAELELP